MIGKMLRTLIVTPLALFIFSVMALYFPAIYLEFFDKKEFSWILKIYKLMWLTAIHDLHCFIEYGRLGTEFDKFRKETGL